MSNMPDNSETSQQPAPAIRVLHWPEPMRLRPQMYIYPLNEVGILTLICTAVDNSVDEFMAGTVSRIEVRLMENGVVSVQDDGPGIPVGSDPQRDQFSWERILTGFHTGPRFGRKLTGAAPYETASLRESGLTVVNALSEWFHVDVYQGGQHYRQEYQRGLAQTAVQILPADPADRGTLLSFKADPLIFGTAEPDADLLVGHLSELCYLVQGLKIGFTDERLGQERVATIGWRDGIRSWVRHLSRYDLNDTLPPPFYVAATLDQTAIEGALQYTWNWTRPEQIWSFVNNGRTPDGGTHVTGFLHGLTIATNQYSRAHQLLTENEPDLTAEAVQEGMWAIVKVNLPNPWFGATRTELRSPIVEQQVATVMQEAWLTHLELSPETAQQLVEACREKAAARAAAANTKRRKKRVNKQE